jgi:CRP-like cAMP-binding protein
MIDLQKLPFDAEAFLTSAGLGRKIVQMQAKQAFFSQGDPADSIFYLQDGRAKLTVFSANGKEATITLLSAGDFVGEECLAAVPGLRMATATAITPCTALSIERGEMIRVMHEEPAFSDRFLSFLLARSMRIQADLVDQLFNSSEKRLARILLLMAQFAKPGQPESLIPKISQETLAEMVGTTRSRVSFFMNRFRKLGFIEYNGGGIHVHKSLLNVVLLDQLPEAGAADATVADTPEALPEGNGGRGSGGFPAAESCGDTGLVAAMTQSTQLGPGTLPNDGDSDGRSSVQDRGG